MKLEMFQRILAFLLILCASNCIKLANSPTDLSTLLTLALSPGSAPGRFVAFAATTNRRAESSGNGSWSTSVTFTGPSQIVRVATTEGSSLVGLDGATVGTIWRSSDAGLTWTSVSGLGAAALQQVTACGNKVLVLPVAGANVTGYYSSNGGASFTPVTIRASGTFTLGYAVCVENTFYVSYSGSATNVNRSTDGINWTQASTAPAAAPIVMAGSGSNVYGIPSGASAAFTRSTDGGVNFSAGESVAGFRGDFGLFGGATVMNGVAHTAMWNQGPQCLFRRSNFGLGGSSSNIQTCVFSTTSSQIRRMENTAGVLVAVGNGTAGANDAYIIYRSTDAGVTFATDTLPAGLPTIGFFSDVVVVH
ncbi:MAG: hypothetical protein JNM27_11530 [Leptospirales bacterium]|nr:hypothetical protein [Leptospirales bacterium]